MPVMKDLLYSKNNKFLDIARVSVALSVLAFWGCVITMAVRGEFDPMAVGGGCAAIFTGAGAWIYARQKQEETTQDGPDNNA